MQTLITALLWFCALGCALLGGLYFAFSAFIMTALRDVGAAGITGMNSINRVILRSWFMPLFFGTTLGCAGLVVVGAMDLHEPRAVYLVGGGVLHVLGMFVVTMLFNVPLNDALQNVTQESRTGMAIWGDYLRRWTRWNHVRTISCAGASALFMIGLLLTPGAAP